MEYKLNRKGLHMDRVKLETLIIEGKITLSDVIDIVIDLNGIVGVGLISLSEDIKKYIIAKGGN